MFVLINFYIIIELKKVKEDRLVFNVFYYYLVIKIMDDERIMIIFRVFLGILYFIV